VGRLLAIDVDHFKKINDTYGHPRGDAVLVGIANALRTSIRDTDALARFGGEEFVVVMPETNDGGALEAAERIRHVISRTPFERLDRPVTISVGVSVYDPSPDALHVIDVARMLERADAALYLAKKHGRDRVELADVLSAPLSRVA
jgi:diguanylate cyclase (GGDEF)-like protein